MAIKSSAPICQQFQHMPAENLYTCTIAVMHMDQLHFEWVSSTWKNKISCYLILDAIVLAMILLVTNNVLPPWYKYL